MKADRIKRFNSTAEGVLVTPADGGPSYRGDGKPLTDADKAILAGRDPVAEQIQQEKQAA